MPVRTRSQTSRTTTGPGMLDRLPPELLHHILDSIDPLDRIEREDALCRCSLVSKTLCTAARPLLWRDLAPLGPEMPLLLDGVRNNPALASLVRRITYNDNCDPIVDVLDTFTQLEVVKLAFMRFDATVVREAEWERLELDTLVVSGAEITAPPSSLTFSSLSTLVIDNFRATPDTLARLLRPAVLPFVRALSLDGSYRLNSLAFPDLPLPLLSNLEVLQVPLDYLPAVSSDIVAGPAPLLVTMGDYIEQFSDGLDELPSSTSIQHLCLTGDRVNTELHGTALATYHMEAACRAVSAWLSRSTTPPLRSLWISPHLDDVLGSPNASLDALLAMCKTAGTKVGWLAPYDVEVEDEPYEAILDERVRRYFRALKAERDSKET
ncbi:hypothetical protein JCM8097_005692 [Rhodosporidiobolus ruineniae]